MESMNQESLYGPDKMNVPVFAILAKSPFWPADTEQFFRSIAPDFEIQWWEGVGHFLMMEKPKEFNDASDRFSKQESSIEINSSTNERGIVMADVKPIPEGYHSITPYLIIDGAADALEYYKKAFGATELFRMEHQGKIGHAEMKIGDSPFMLSDEHPEMGYRGPKSLGGSPVGIMIYVDDVDTIYKQALDAGGTEMKAITGSVLWRSFRYADRSVWARLDRRNPQRRRYT